MATTALSTIGLPGQPQYFLAKAQKPGDVDNIELEFTIIDYSLNFTIGDLDIGFTITDPAATFTFNAG